VAEAHVNRNWYDVPIEIGDTDAGRQVLNGKDRRLHMHVLGTTGTGKTKFLERLIRQDIDRGQGVCVIDPTGNLYNNLVRWCETHYLQDEREIVLFDPTERDWVCGFNPLSFGTSGASRMDVDQLAFGTAATRAAIQRAWGEAKNVATPLLRRLLNMLIYTLAEHRLTFAEGQLLMHPDPTSPVRHYLTHTLQNATAHREWESVASIRPNEYEALFGSVRNRLFDFLLQPRLEAMIAQEHTIDWRRAMDEGHVVLVNLGTGGMGLYPEIGKLVGSLIVNALVLAARSRTDIHEEERRPFYLYIDECHRYLNDDIAEILDELRQFGLHLILAHQNLKQLQEDGSERIAASIMSNARTKVVFQLPDEDDADRMARRIFRGAVDMEEAKHAFDKPTPTGTFRKEILHGESFSDSETDASVATTETEDAGGFVMEEISTKTFREGDSAQGYRTETMRTTNSPAAKRATSVTTSAGQHARSRTTNAHEVLVPEYALMPTSAYSLEEQYERKAAHIATLPARHAIVKPPDGLAYEIITPEVAEGSASDERVQRFKKKVYEKWDFIIPRMEADLAKQDRLEYLQRRAIEFQRGGGVLLEGELVKVEEFDPWDNG
jgi:hypothetical protein